MIYLHYSIDFMWHLPPGFISFGFQVQSLLIVIFIENTLRQFYHLDIPLSQIVLPTPPSSIVQSLRNFVQGFEPRSVKT